LVYDDDDDDDDDDDIKQELSCRKQIARSCAHNTSRASIGLITP